MSLNKGDQVGKDEYLLRRIYRSDKRYIDKKTGRPTSRAFVPRPKDEGKLSVDLERLTTLEKAVNDPYKYILFRLISNLIFQLGLNCIYDPVEYNNAHAIIIGFDKEDESVPGILARKSERIDVLHI